MQKPVSLDKVMRTAMLVGHQWMPVSAEDKKIVNRIGASMVNEVGASVVNEVGASMVNEVGASVVVIIEAIGASVVVISITMADRVWASVVVISVTMADRLWASVADWGGTMADRIIERNLVKMVVVVFVGYKQSLLATKFVERVQNFQ